MLRGAISRQYTIEVWAGESGLWQGRPRRPPVTAPRDRLASARCRPGLANPIRAGAIAAHHARGKPDVGPHELPDEFDIQRAHATVFARYLWEGASRLDDQPVGTLLYGPRLAALVSNDLRGTSDTFGSRLPLELCPVGLCEAMGDALEERLERLGAGQLVHLFQKEVRELLVSFRVELVALLRQAVDERGPANATPLLVGLDEALAFEDSEVLADAGGCQVKVRVELLDRRLALAP